jgi:hypothetical protein
MLPETNKNNFTMNQEIFYKTKKMILPGTKNFTMNQDVSKFFFDFSTTHSLTSQSTNSLLDTLKDTGNNKRIQTEIQKYGIGMLFDISITLEELKRIIKETEEATNFCFMLLIVSIQYFISQNIKETNKYSLKGLEIIKKNPEKVTILEKDTFYALFQTLNKVSLENSEESLDNERELLEAENKILRNGNFKEFDGSFNFDPNNFGAKKLAEIYGK